MISQEAFFQLPGLAFQSSVLPHCPAPTTALQALLPPTQATTTPANTARGLSHHKAAYDYNPQTQLELFRKHEL